MNSVWHENTAKPKFPTLQGNEKCDVLIIGGGITGILTAHMLSSHGIDCIIAEADEICSGVTKNTTAKITVQHGLFCAKMIKSSGIEKTKQYLDANQRALTRYFEMCENIDCDFKEKDSFVYSLIDENKLKNEINALKSIGYNVEFQKNLPLPFITQGAVVFKHQAEFNPLKFLYHIADGLKIYEHTVIRGLKGNIASTYYGEIRANKIICATHFPFINKHGLYPLKMYQNRSYVIALKNAADVGGMYIDESKVGLSFRNYGDLLLLGGGSHRTGKNGGNWAELRMAAQKYYPDSKEESFWATQDCMTLDDISYIGKYSKNTQDFYVATGFNKWGMTSAMAAAEILCDEITGKKNPCAAVFNPSRSIFKPQLAVNMFQAVTGLVNFSRKRCPHLGCALKWNKAEHTWDCPCHGSRFTESGELIDNPATGNLK